MWLTPGTLPSVSRPLGLEARLGASPGVPPLLFKWGSTTPHTSPPVPPGPQGLGFSGRRREGLRSGGLGTSELSGLQVGEARRQSASASSPPTAHVTCLVALTGIQGLDLCVWACLRHPWAA